MPTVLLDLTILCTDTLVRGIGRYAAELALALARFGDHTVSVRLLEEIRWDGSVRVTEDAAAALARFRDPGRRETGRWSWAYRCRLGLARAARHVGADVVHLPHSGATPLFDARAARIVTCHDLIPLRYPEHYADWRDGWGLGRLLLDTRRFRSADHVIAISHATADDLRSILRVPAHKITVVPHGLDHDRWRPEPDGDDEPYLRKLELVDRPYLLYVGDGDWRKNPTGMFRALAEVRRTRGELILVWAGRLSAERQRGLREQVERAGVGDAVRFIGHVDDPGLFALYRSALASLLVSKAEGFGLPVLEGMAMGCPVITSDRSSMKEVAGDAAYLVDPDDSSSIARAIQALAADGALRGEYGRRGMARAAAFTHERQARETLAVYRAAADRPLSRPCGSVAP